MSSLLNRIEKLERFCDPEETLPTIIFEGVLPKHQEPPEGRWIIGYQTWPSDDKQMKWAIGETETKHECLDRANADMTVAGIRKPFMLLAVHNDEEFNSQ